MIEIVKLTFVVFEEADTETKTNTELLLLIVIFVSPQPDLVYSPVPNTLVVPQGSI